MRARDGLVRVLVWGAVVVVVAALFAIVADLAVRGGSQLSLAYLIDVPQRAGLQGGIGPVLASTVALLVVAVAVALPLGVLTAVALFELTSPRFVVVVRRSLDLLAGVPSIVFGLFGMKLFCEVLGLGWSILAGGLTLAGMVLPLVVRATDEGLRAVAVEQRLACAAVGASRLGAQWNVLLPQAAPGILAGVVLGTGRALAETAAVLFTAGASLRMPDSLLAPGRALAVHVYTLSIEVPGGTTRAAAAGLVLLLLVSVSSVIAHVSVSWFARWRVGAR